MANDLNIDSLSIEFEVTSTEALNAVDKLTEKLNALKAATQGGLQDASSVVDGLKHIAQAAKDINSVDASKLSAITDAVQKMNKISVTANLSGVAEQVKDLAKAAAKISEMPTIDQTKVDSISALGTALSSLSNIPQLPDLSSTARSLSQLGTMAAGISGVDMQGVKEKIEGLSDALKPLENLGKTNLSSFINSLKKLPEISTALSNLDMGTFSSQISELATAIHPLATEFSTLAQSVASLPAPLQNAVASLAGYSGAAGQATNKTNSLLTKIKNLFNIGAIIAVFGRIKGILQSSNAYVENLNLFSVAMGDAADEALNFANRVNELMGIDVSEWIRNQGTFKQIASGFGVVEDKAVLMSQNLTQLGYDISSFFNISVEESMLKLQSGISGELEPLRRLGYALDVATLQQVAYNHGIYESVQNMTQAQKSQIRYIAIMEQSSNAMNDMARTIESPANQMRIFEQRIDQFKRAVGNGLMPIVSAALPYLTAFVRILTETAQSLADFLGFEIPQFNYGDIVAESNRGIASSFDDATAAAKTFKGTLSSIDQLNIIGSHKESGTGDLTNPYDLDLDLPSYDFLDGLSESADDVYNKMKKVFSGIVGFVKEALPYVAAFGAAFVGIKLGTLLTQLPKLAGAFGGLLTAWSPWKTVVAASASSFVLLFNSVKNLTKGTGNLKNNIAQLAVGLGIAGTAIAGFIKFGNPVGAVITGIAAALGVLAGAYAAEKEADEAYSKQLSETITYMDRGGISIGGLTNGFTEYFSTVTNHYDDILANTQAFEENEDQLRKAASEVANLTDKYMNLDSEMTEADAQNLANNIKIIGDGIETSLGVATQGIIDELKGKFRDFATSLGQDVDDMVGKFYLLQGMGNTALASQQKHADELVNSIISGNLSLEERQKALQELNETVKNMGANVDLGTDESYSFYDALQKMTNAKINFEDPEELTGNINSLKEMAAAAKSSIDEARLAQLKELDTTQQRYEQMIDDETGKSIKELFDEINGSGSFDTLFKDAKATFELGFTTDKNKIDTAVSLYVSMIQDQLDKSQLQFAEGKFREEGTGGFLATTGALVKNLFAKGDNGEALYYDTIERYKKQFEDLHSGVYDALSETGIKITEQSEEIGGYLLQGMESGVLKNQDNLNAALDAAARGAIDEVKKICGVASPSKVFDEIGGYLMLGMENGIRRKEDSVISELGKFSREVNGAVDIKPFEWNELGEMPDLSYSNVYRPKTSYSYAAQTTPAVQSAGYDPRAVTEAAQLWGSVDRPIDVNVQLNSVVELDGDQVGQAVTNYQNGRVIASNGMAK